MNSVCNSRILNLDGFPIQKSPDQSLLTTPRRLSQLATSFIASECQGIHHILLVAWPLNCLEYPKDMTRITITINKFQRAVQNPTESEKLLRLKSIFFPSQQRLVEVNGIEPMTFAVQARRSPSWATPPYDMNGGPRKIWTSDLTLIRRAL